MVRNFMQKVGLLSNKNVFCRNGMPHMYKMFEILSTWSFDIGHFYEYSFPSLRWEKRLQLVWQQLFVLYL
jgi:hypothetical protein